MDISKINVINL